MLVFERTKTKFSLLIFSIPMIRTMRRRDPRQMEEEEEMWFQEDDDFADMNNKDLATTLGEFPDIKFDLISIAHLI